MQKKKKKKDFLTDVENRVSKILTIATLWSHSLILDYALTLH